jgi:hypothetical protein
MFTTFSEIPAVQVGDKKLRWGVRGLAVAGRSTEL